MFDIVRICLIGVTCPYKLELGLLAVIEYKAYTCFLPMKVFAYIGVLSSPLDEDISLQLLV